MRPSRPGSRARRARDCSSCAGPGARPRDRSSPPCARRRRLRRRAGSRSRASHDLADADLDADGEPVTTDLVLVCGHGSRDACCALHGTSVFGALAGRLGDEELWISSHQGGHRFAANVLVLPLGLQLGRLGPDSAPLAVARALAGRDRARALPRPDVPRGEGAGGRARDSGGDRDRRRPRSLARSPSTSRWCAFAARTGASMPPSSRKEAGVGRPGELRRDAGASTHLQRARPVTRGVSRLQVVRPIGDPRDVLGEILRGWADRDERSEDDAHPAVGDERAAGGDRAGPRVAGLEDGG